MKKWNNDADLKILKFDDLKIKSLIGTTSVDIHCEFKSSKNYSI